MLMDNRIVCLRQFDVFRRVYPDNYSVARELLQDGYISDLRVYGTHAEARITIKGKDLLKTMESFADL